MPRKYTKKKKVVKEVRKKRTPPQICVCSRCDFEHHMKERIRIKRNAVVEHVETFLKKRKIRLDSGIRISAKELIELFSDSKYLSITVCPDCGYWQYCAI
jgi:hypothetical protein